jgi:dienelactone hydrolase
MRLRTARPASWVGFVSAIMALWLAGCTVPPPPEPGGTDPGGPGPYAYAQAPVGWGFGFAGGTVYYPTDADLGVRGGVAVAPGFTESQSAISWYGPRLASHGFIVITIDTNSVFDQPASRGDQLLAALDYLTTKSTVAARVDKDRLAVMGHSMGGGGTLEAARKKHALRAAIPLAAFSTTTDWSTNVTPTLVVACQNDQTAPVADYSLKFYNSITSEKAFLEIAGGDHSCPNSINTTISTSVVSWLKHFVDGDTSDDSHLCPAPTGSAISSSLGTCPY